MTGDQVNLEMLALRRRYAALNVRFVTGERSTLYSEVRCLTDEVVCLLDEAPDEKRDVINGLAEKCEALLRAIAN